MTSSSPQGGSGDDDSAEDLFENAPCGYLSLSSSGLIVKVNRTFCAWTGFDPAALTSTRFRDLLTVGSRIYMETHLVPLLRMQGFAHEVALDLVMKNAERLPMLVNATERRDRDGSHITTRLTVFNATERRRYERELVTARAAADAAQAQALSANEELLALNATLEMRIAEAVAARQSSEESLRQSQKMEAVGQLTGGIAHDFNNLLAGITGSIELLQLHLKRGRHDVLPRYAEAALGTARRAAALTHRLLAFSRHQKLEPKIVDVNLLIGGMEDLIRRSIGPAVDLEVIGAGGLWRTLIDPNQLENALLNLCINARDAMPRGGRLTVETSNKWFDDRAAKARDLSAGQYVCVSVSDTGTGMPPTVIARAFDPFYTTKPLGAGTGLGLSMVYGFARQSGGHAAIYSELGKGTTLNIYLPRSRGETEAPSASLVVLGSSEAARTETVLVVDDEATVRMFVAEVVQQLGYHVIEAADGQAGLAILHSHARVDLLITDVGLPGGINGRQMADAALVERPHLKVLFVTGYADNAASGHGFLDPGMQMLSKPFGIEDLTRKVSAFFV